MACRLIRSPEGTNLFDGKTGDPVQITVDSVSGSAFIVSMVYDLAPVTRPESGPWSLTILSGKKLLTIVIEDSIERDSIQIQEVCPDGTKNLLFGPKVFDPVGPSETLTIRGN